MAPSNNSPKPTKAALDAGLPESSAKHRAPAGKIRPAVLLWALGVPIPLVLIFVLVRGCT